MLRTVKANYCLSLGDNLLGEYVVQTGYEGARLEKAIINSLLNYLTLAGLKVTKKDIQIVEIIDPFLGGTFDNNKESKYSFVRFKSGNGSGPWHMLAGETESGGLACGANRRMSSATDRQEDDDWPDGKGCAKCKRIWKGKEKSL